MILMWSLGLPVIATRTESHKRVMNSIKSDWLCDSINEWETKIMKLSLGKKERLKYINSIKNFLKNDYSTKSISNIWDKVISL